MLLRCHREPSHYSWRQMLSSQSPERYILRYGRCSSDHYSTSAHTGHICHFFPPFTNLTENPSNCWTTYFIPRISDLLDGHPFRHAAPYND